jgi:two-component system response regulator YesN
MEALATGAANVEAVNWKGITDAGIQEHWKLSNEQRNVELEVKKYIREHMTEDITVKDIAAQLHFNPQHLMRAFKTKTGSCVMEYVTKTRMETAKKILSDTKLPIKEVAHMTGYVDYAYFTRVFHKKYGISPTEYRKGR